MVLLQHFLIFTDKKFSHQPDKYNDFHLCNTNVTSEYFNNILQINAIIQTLSGDVLKNGKCFRKKNVNKGTK